MWRMSSNMWTWLIPQTPTSVVFLEMHCSPLNLVPHGRHGNDEMISGDSARRTEPVVFYDWSSEIISLWHHKGFWHHSKVSDLTPARCWLRPLGASKHVREPIKDQLEWKAQSSVPTAGCKQRAKYILLLAFFFYNRHTIILRCYFRTFGT